MEKPIIKEKWKESTMEAMKGMRKVMKGISDRLMVDSAEQSTARH